MKLKTKSPKDSCEEVEERFKREKRPRKSKGDKT